MNDYLENWLRACRSIAIACMERNAARAECCPAPCAKTVNRDALKRIEVLTAAITRRVTKLVKIERRSGLGGTALLDTEPTEPEAAVIALLVAARLDNYADTVIRSVADITTLVGDSQAEAVYVRALFRSGRPLYPHVWLGRDVVLDGCSVALRESSFNLATGQSPDDTERLCDNYGLLARR
jgi:hypothetical protein